MTPPMMKGSKLRLGVSSGVALEDDSWPLAVDSGEAESVASWAMTRDGKVSRVDAVSSRVTRHFIIIIVS